MKVWVSRSRPGADRQAADLQAAGYDVVVAPAIEIRPLRPALPGGAFDLVLFLSEHAVRHALPELQAEPWFVRAGVLAVGERTADVLKARGIVAGVPAEPTSEGLLDLPALRRLDGRRVLLAAGAGGRRLLGQALHDRGAEVVRYECYRRVEVNRLEARVLDCTAVIAASGDGLRQVARLWLQGGGPADVAVLVPSARVAAIGVELGLTNLHDCAGADSEAWLRGLAQLQSAGT